ncbi:AAA family ATPase [Leptotrichia wadei]|uniref:AAA family ATPase n=1 Tax=Leptotrichia wadei TaxID=157687 RepID=UPI0028DB5001|nr:AAA family ATPase [Leptotrichia wadei]
MKKIPVGIEDFKEIINNNCYYVDKTKFIANILDDGSKVKLFTRPRRFGKTLNMSMLKYFFDIYNAKENKELFNGLDIEKSEYFAEQGQYPVVFISLKGIKADSWENFLNSIKSLISSLYNEFEYVRSSLNESELKTFDKIWFKKDDGDYENSLKYLTAYLYKYYNKEIVLLIDEYDSPLISAYEYHYYDKAIIFFKIFYGEALKTNQYLKTGIMTGIIRVIKAGIFSDLNNLRIYSILSNHYSEFFGFTEDEVKKALCDYNIEFKLADVKLWYDGYKFGDSEVYNPWSILNFLFDKKLAPNWINSSGNFLINDILKNVDAETMETLEQLFSGESVEENINGNSDLSVLLGQEEIWELLLFSGYLTVDEKIGEDYENVYSLRLPNREVREFFRQKFIEVNFGESLFRKAMESLKKLKFNYFEKYLQNILLRSTSYNDTKNEDFYHGLVLGMMFYLDNHYYVKSNEESGLGRYDLMIEPRNKNNRGFILEFKVTKDENSLEKVSKEAVNQIIKKKYDVALKDRGIEDITLVGVAFCGKMVKVFYS